MRMRKGVQSMNLSKIMWIEPSRWYYDSARIGRVKILEDGNLLQYKEKIFHQLKKKNLEVNYYDANTKNEYWISECSQDGSDAIYAIKAEIDDDVREEYWLQIRKLKKYKNNSVYIPHMKYSEEEMNRIHAERIADETFSLAEKYSLDLVVESVIVDVELRLIMENYKKQNPKNRSIENLVNKYISKEDVEKIKNIIQTSDWGNPQTMWWCDNKEDLVTVLFNVFSKVSSKKMIALNDIIVNENVVKLDLWQD
jgi:hypothetical protein